MKQILMMLVVVWFLGVGYLPVHATPILSFDVSDPAPLVGDTITVDVVAFDVTELFTFNLDIGFDPTILGIDTVAPGPFLGSGGGLTLGALSLFSFDTSTPGEIRDISDSLLGPVPGVTGSGVLATLTFEALSAGNSSLTFLNLNTLAGTELTNSIGAPITIASASSASVNPVPEPSTIWLLASAIGVFVLIHVRSRWRAKD